VSSYHRNNNNSGRIGTRKMGKKSKGRKPKPELKLPMDGGTNNDGGGQPQQQPRLSYPLEEWQGLGQEQVISELMTESRRADTKCSHGARHARNSLPAMLTFFMTQFQLNLEFVVNDELNKRL